MDQNQDKLNEALSALMDGEADELELRRILRELPSSPELYAAWKRYHSVRASLQQDIHRDPAVDLLPGFHTRLGAEQNTQEFVHQGPLGLVLRSRIGSRIVRYLGQGAIAASVAVAALMGFSVLETADTSTPAASHLVAEVAEATDAGATPALNGEFNAAEVSRTVAFDVEAFDRLEQAVYRELSELPPPEQIPVNYNPALPVNTTPAE